MEFKGTKGKWSYQYTGGQNESEYILKQVEICECCDNKKEYRIGSFKTSGRRIDHDANALLISKAPEMLEMLEIIYQQVDFSFSNWGGDNGLKMEEKIKQLIKEATEL